MKNLTLLDLNRLCQKTAVAHLGIEFTEIGAQSLTATVPVDERTIQPFGLLHGGISATLAETLGSAAAMLHCAENQIPVGTELNISHLKAVKYGKATGIAVPLHLGKRSHVWEIKIYDEADNLCAIARINIALIEKKDKK